LLQDTIGAVQASNLGSQSRALSSLLTTGRKVTLRWHQLGVTLSA
jgi:hypothetical protein